MQTAPAIDIRPPVARLEKTPLYLADIEQVYAERVRRSTAESSPAKGATASAGTRTAVHSELSTSTLAQLLLHESAGHDLGPLRQIAELYRAHAFHARAGPFQKCWRLKP
jgi:predicted alpha/beta-hydrolase family hydrolase